MYPEKANRMLIVKQVMILVSKISLILLIVLSGLIISVNKFFPNFVDKYKIVFENILYPVTEIFGSAEKSVDGAAHAVGNILYANTIAGQKKELERENYKARLELYLMQQEMAALKKKLNFIPQYSNNFYTARIVSRTPGPIVNAAYIKSPDIDKIEKDNVVLNEDGLVGQIESISGGIASVIMLTDKRSSIPVKSKNFGKRAILVGTGGNYPRLDYITSTNKLSVGEEILTSGDGGIFPADIPVGYVKDMDKGQVTIETYVDWSALDYVFILK